MAPPAIDTAYLTMTTRNPSLLPDSLFQGLLRLRRRMASVPCPLPRILEPERMDSPDEAAVYDGMDFRVVNGRFVADFLSAHGPCQGGTILDVGTGSARIPIALCLGDLLARVIGLDAAAAMLKLGRRNVGAAGLAERIKLMLGDAKAIALGDGACEAVISNGTFHHLPDPTPVLSGMVRLVALGGTLFVRDLLRPGSKAELDRLVAMHAGLEPADGQAIFRDSLHAAFTLREIRAIVASIGLPPEAVTITSDRHWSLAWKKSPPRHHEHVITLPRPRVMKP